MEIQKAKRKQDEENPSNNSINRMDEFFLRFPHLPEQFFEELDFKSIASARLVAKSWKQFIDERYPFKDEIAELKKKCWVATTLFHLACRNGHADIAEFIMKNSAKLNIDLNAKDNCGWTAFHLACRHGQVKVAEIIMKNSAEFNIELNAKNKYGSTAFHYACMNGRTIIVDMMINKSESLKIDLTARNNNEGTGFQRAQFWRRTDVVNLIRNKMPQIAF